MAKKNKLPPKYSAVGYAVWDVRRTIREAENVARWNPWLAHAWMAEALDMLSIDKPFFAEYDAAVDRINARWVYMSRLNWFNSVEFWKREDAEYPVTLLSHSDDF